MIDPFTSLAPVVCVLMDSPAPRGTVTSTRSNNTLQVENCTIDGIAATSSGWISLGVVNSNITGIRVKSHVANVAVVGSDVGRDGVTVEAYHGRTLIHKSRLNRISCDVVNQVNLKNTSYEL